MHFSKNNPFNGGYNNFPTSGYNNNQGYNNQGYNPNPNPPHNSNTRFQSNKVNDIKMSKVQGLLNDCSYSSQYYDRVYEAIYKLMTAYPFLQADILSYKQGTILKSFIQIKGALEVNFHGDSLFVFVNLMLPQRFPDQAPNIRIINTEPQYFDVNPHYVQYQSKSDRNSYMISKMLQTVMKWNNQSNIIDVLKESERLMQKWFPFKKLKPGQKPTSQMVNHEQPFIKKAQNYNQNTNNNNNSFNYNNQGFNNQGFNNQPTNKNTSINQGFNSNSQPQFVTHTQVKVQTKMPNNNDKLNSNINNNNTKSNPPVVQNNSKVPIKLNQLQQLAKLQKDDYIQKNKTFVTLANQMVNELLNEHKKNFTANQGLAIIKKCLQYQSKSIKQQHNQLDKTVKQTENQEINFEGVITPVNDWSKQLLQMICIQKAAHDTLDYIKSLYQNGEMTFEQFLKQIRKVEEEKFLCSVMIKKKMKDKV